MNELTSLDHEALGELKAVMGEDFSMLIEAFFNDSEDRIVQLQSHIDAEDAEELRRTAHSFKGSSGNVGALRLQEFCRQLEAEAKEGRFGQTGQLLEEIESEYRHVNTLLAREMEA